MVTGASPKKVKLDRIDLRILSDLQANGRMSNVDLANNAGISAPPCLRRVRTMEEDGVIKGYFAYLDSRKLGFGVTAFATVRLKDQSEQNLAQFEEAVRQWDHIREAYLISGDFDVMLRIVARDWDEYQEFITDKITQLPNVASVKSAIKVRTSKYQPGFPLDAD